MIKQHYQCAIANAAVETFYSIASDFASGVNVVTGEQLKLVSKKALQAALVDD